MQVKFVIQTDHLIPVRRLDLAVFNKKKKKKKERNETAVK